MNDFDLQTLLKDIIEENNFGSLRNIRTYEEAGVLTRDKGLVVTDKAGNEFQINIVQSC